MPSQNWLVLAEIDWVVWAVNEYHSVLFVSKHSDPGSAGSPVAAVRSCESENGSAPIGVALAKSSFPGGRTWLTENCRLPPPFPPLPQQKATMK